MSLNLADIATENYKVIIIPDPEHPEATIYGLQNKDTEVIEYYDNLLPRLYEALQHTERTYKEMLGMINAPDLILVEESGPAH